MSAHVGHSAWPPIDTNQNFCRRVNFYSIFWSKFLPFQAICQPKNLNISLPLPKISASNLIFCELKPHVEFHNPRGTHSGRKVTGPEEIEINALNRGLYVPPATPKGSTRRTHYPRTNRMRKEKYTKFALQPSGQCMGSKCTSQSLCSDNIHEYDIHLKCWEGSIPQYPI